MQPGQVRRWVALDQHKFSIVGAGWRRTTASRGSAGSRRPSGQSAGSLASWAVRPDCGERVKTGRRDARKLVSLYRSGLLRFVHPPTAELAARSAARGMMCAARGWRPANRVLAQMLRDGRIFREARRRGGSCIAPGSPGRRVDDPLAQEALEQLLIHLDGFERQLASLDARLAEIVSTQITSTEKRSPGAGQPLPSAANAS